MSIFDFLTLFGGLAMFLYGMRLMGDGLKESSSGTLKKAMESVTNNPIKAFLLGLGVTAIIQSSTATIVITSGLVGAGLLSLHQSLGIIIGANVGTTVTGQIIRLLDLDAGGATSWLQLFKPSSLAPIALIIGIVIIMTGRLKSSRQIGNIAIGFGILFSGLLNMTSAVTVLTESGMVEGLFSSLGNNPFLGYVTGATVAFILQSSSATVGILQAFSASGMLTFKAVYPVIVGVYLGDSVTTGIVCFIGAQAEQKRVGIFNILFNIGKMALILIGVEVLHRVGVLDGIWNMVVNSGVIANANTIFNIAASILLFPLVSLFEKTSLRLIPDDKEPESKYKDKIDALNPMFFDTPEGKNDLVKIVTDVLGDRNLEMPRSLSIPLRGLVMEGAAYPAYSISNHLFVLAKVVDGAVNLFDSFYIASFDGDTFESAYTKVEGIRNGELTVTIKKNQTIHNLRIVIILTMLKKKNLYSFFYK